MISHKKNRTKKERKKEKIGKSKKAYFWKKLNLKIHYIYNYG